MHEARDAVGAVIYVAVHEAGAGKKMAAFWKKTTPPETSIVGQ
jgi:hypothetical protein